VADLLSEQADLNAHIVKLSMQTSQGGKPSSGRTAKMPDPPVLTDRKDLKFEDWLPRMRAKMRTNKDHYPDDDARMMYILSQTGGDAATHLAPHLREDAANPYLTMEDMLEHLKTVYLDLNRKDKAKAQFHELMQRADDLFQPFLTKFLHLAGEAEIPDSEYKYKLNQRLNYHLRNAVANAYVKEKGFQHFSTYCTKIANNQQNAYEIQQRGKKDKKGEPKGRGRGRAPADCTTPDCAELQRNRTPAPAPAAEPCKQFMSAEKRERLSKEGRCFTCEQKEHMRNDCSNKPAADVNHVNNTERELEKMTGKEGP
jgi:hypothetical protein